MRRRYAAALLAAAMLGACGSSGGPEVGKCTNSDPDLGVELDVQIVDCGDDEATTKIVKEAKDRSECESGTLRAEDSDTVFCTEPLEK